MGARIAAWLLVLGERVKVWTTTSSKLTTIELAKQDARQKVIDFMHKEDDSMAKEAIRIATDDEGNVDTALLEKLPVIGDAAAGLTAKSEVWTRLTVEAAD